MHQMMSVIEELKESVEHVMEHKYMGNYIGKPEIDTEKLFILSSLMQNTSLSDKKKKHYIITAILVQLALDTHEKVPDSAKQEDAQHSIHMQLSVLAGDYYSGLYYKLLSEIDEIELISVLSTAIRKINEAKMKLYYNNYNTEQELIAILKDIQATLFLYVADYIGALEIKDFLADWLLLLFLADTKNQSLFEKISEKDSHLHIDFVSLRQKNQHTVSVLAKQLPDQYRQLQKHVCSTINIR